MSSSSFLLGGNCKILKSMEPQPTSYEAAAKLEGSTDRINGAKSTMVDRLPTDRNQKRSKQTWQLCSTRRNRFGFLTVIACGFFSDFLVLSRRMIWTPISTHLNKCASCISVSIMCTMLDICLSTT